jgi:hypothetical protein
MASRVAGISQAAVISSIVAAHFAWHLALLVALHHVGCLASMPAPMRSCAAGSVRVVSYNVRRFTDDDGASTVLQIANSLKKLQPSLVCLQEVMK